MAEIKYLNEAGVKALVSKVKSYVQKYHAENAVEYTFEVLDTLPSVPTTDAAASSMLHKFYFIGPKSGSAQASDSNVYDEYVLIKKATNSYAFEKIGSTSIDLTGYLVQASTTGSDGITVTATGSNGVQIKHSNKVTAATKGTNATTTLSNGGSFVVPKVTYDAQGHITSASDTTLTLPTITIPDIPVTGADRGLDVSSKKVGHTNSVTAGTAANSATSITVGTAFNAPKISYDAYGHVTGVTNASTTISLANSGATAGTYASNTAGTLGDGGSFKVPTVAVNAKGIVTSISEKIISIPSKDTHTAYTTAEVNSWCDSVFGTN